MPRPIVITGGGTGGHLFPMRAVADALTARGVSPGDLRFVGSRRGQEAALLGDGAVSLTRLPGRGLRRSWRGPDVAANVGAVAGLGVALVRATALVARWRPAAVVSVGGYASFATSAAAVLCRRPLVLVDLDATPGAAHRLLARFAARRCVAYDDGTGATVTGAPVRASLLDVDRSSDARRRARAAQVEPIDDGRTVVVVMTGSLGAARVNDAVSELAQIWSARNDRTLVHVAGRRDYERVRSRRPAVAALDYRILSFADMAELWAVCDVAVCRAGATTIAEVTALGVAAVLVPLPGAPDDHQGRNARVLADAGAAFVLADATCTGAALAAVLDDVAAPERREAMEAAAARLGRRDAADAVALVVLEASRS